MVMVKELEAAHNKIKYFGLFRGLRHNYIPLRDVYICVIN